ncbi:YraN family protein [Polymorphospora rubra]|uniref:YraN family protein n=1 Tax=Polymorphospora rubra TaxID=338584 RepID=UPI0033F6AC37
MTLVRQAVGAYGERRAVQHLVAAGLRVVARNWRCVHGEVDIIAWDGETLVFCEVKTRRSTTYGPPAAAVVPAKARRLRRLAAAWLAGAAAHPREVRFDVVAVHTTGRGPARVEHVRAAF